MKLFEMKEKLGKDDNRIKLEPCIECGKPIVDGYYGRYADGGVCSKACDILHMKEKKHEVRPVSPPV